MWPSYWPLIDLNRSCYLDTGFLLDETNHMTWLCLVPKSSNLKQKIICGLFSCFKYIFLCNSQVYGIAKPVIAHLWPILSSYIYRQIIIIISIFSLLILPTPCFSLPGRSSPTCPRSTSSTMALCPSCAGGDQGETQSVIHKVLVTKCWSQSVR